LLYHAELPGPIDQAMNELRSRAGGARTYATYLATRPKAAENQAIALALALCREHGVRTHIVHLSSHEALSLLQEARADDLPVTTETCPHYLTFAADEIPDGATAFKCAPPIRERENREHLWKALAEGLIQMVVTDHSPAPPAMKHLDSGDFLQAWGGISSLQLGLAVTWTGASARGYTLNQLADWMCRAPARLAGLTRKGAIAVGMDADLVVWSPERDFIVEGASLLHRHPLTPYEDMTLRGIVERTYLRGQGVYERGAAIRGAHGQVLSRTTCFR
jgi:allantoinase